VPGGGRVQLVLVQRRWSNVLLGRRLSAPMSRRRSREPFALVLVALPLLALAACSKICLPDGCPSNVRLERSVAISSEDIGNVTITACLNGVCGTGKLAGSADGGTPQCQLPTPLAGARCFFSDADGGSVFVLETNLASPEDGDVFAFEIVRDDSGAVLLDVHATAAYRTFNPDGPGCGGPTCKAADL
jgi:hypothetical protein